MSSNGACALITLEEHFVTKSFLKATQSSQERTPPQMAELQSKLLDLGEGRIADMDKSGIDTQVLSLAAMGFEALEADTASSLARDINDELAAAMHAHPTRFGGFATLGLKDPSTAAKELERCVTELGFKGALVNGTTGGLFLDAPRFLPVFEAAASEWGGSECPFICTLRHRPSRCAMPIILDLRAISGFRPAGP